MRLMNCVLAVMLAGSVLAAGPYYLESTSAARGAGWWNAYHWVDAQGNRSGTDGAALDPAADYIVTNVNGITVANSSDDLVFAGRSLELSDRGRMFVNARAPARIILPEGSLILDSTEGSKFEAADGAIYTFKGNVTVRGSDCVFISEKLNQAFVMDGALFGDGRLRFTKNPATVKLPGDLSVFTGTVSLWVAGSRLEVGENDASCAIEFNGPSTLAVAGDVAVSSLTVPSGSILEIGGRAEMTDGVLTGWTSGHLTVKNTLTAEGQIEVKVLDDALVPVFDDDPPEMMSIAILTVPDATDMDLFSFSCSEAFRGAEFSVVEDADAGTKTVYLNYEPTVTLTVSDSPSQNFSLDYGSALTNAAQWSNGRIPEEGFHYFVRKAGVESPGELLTETHTVFLRTPGGDEKSGYSYVAFQGDSLTIGDGCCLTVMETAFSFTEGRKLLLLDGSAIRNGQGMSPHIIAPVEMPSGTVTVGTWCKCLLQFDQSVSGAAKMYFRGGISGTSSPGGTTVFNGDMSDFDGTFDVDQLRQADYGFLAVRVNDPQYASSALAAFDPASVSLKTQAKFEVLDDVILADGSNRGFMVGDDSGVTVEVADGKSMVIGTRLTIADDGSLVKTGDGTMELGGEVRFGASGAESPTDGKTYALAIEAGALSVTGADACDGLAISFAAGASLTLAYTPDNSALTAYGIRNIKCTAPFVLPEGMECLPLTVTLPAELDRIEHRIALTTVSAEAASSVRAMLSGVSVSRAGFASVTWERTDADGNVTFGRTLKPLGMTVVIR